MAWYRGRGRGRCWGWGRCGWWCCAAWAYHCDERWRCHGCKLAWVDREARPQLAQARVAGQVEEAEGPKRLGVIIRVNGQWETVASQEQQNTHRGAVVVSHRLTHSTECHDSTRGLAATP